MLSALEQTWHSAKHEFHTSLSLLPGKPEFEQPKPAFLEGSLQLDSIKKLIVLHDDVTTLTNKMMIDGSVLSKTRKEIQKKLIAIKRMKIEDEDKVVKSGPSEIHRIQRKKHLAFKNAIYKIANERYVHADRYVYANGRLYKAVDHGIKTGRIPSEKQPSLEELFDKLLMATPKEILDSVPHTVSPSMPYHLQKQWNGVELAVNINSRKKAIKYATKEIAKLNNDAKNAMTKGRTDELPKTAGFINLYSLNKDIADLRKLSPDLADNLLRTQLSFAKTHVENAIEVGIWKIKTSYDSRIATFVTEKIKEFFSVDAPRAEQLADCYDKALPQAHSVIRPNWNSYRIRSGAGTS